MKRRSFLAYSFLFLASCSATQLNSVFISEKETTQESSEIPKTIRFAITDADGMEELEANYEPFRQALAMALGTQVEFVPVDSFIAAAPMMLNNNIDLAWAGPSEYLILQARAKVVPVVSLQRPEFKSVIAVRADSNITNLADLKGKKIDMHKIGVTSSHLSGVRMLMDAGLNPKSDYEMVMPNRHTLQGLKEGKVDAVSKSSHRYRSLIEEEQLSENDYRIIATSPRLPGDIFVASNQLGSKTVELMTSRMLDHQDKLMKSMLAIPYLAKKFNNSSFIAVDTNEYESLREIYRSIGQESLIQ